MKSNPVADSAIVPTYFKERGRLLVILVIGGEVLMALGVYGAFRLGSTSFVTSVVSYFAAFVGSAYIIATAVLIWNNALVKPKLAEALVREIPWGGDEAVAEVQCGAGVVTSLVASRLTTGMALGLDMKGLWNLRQSGSPANGGGAMTPGYQLAEADPRALPIRDSTFDVVISGFERVGFGRLADRIFSVEEMVRILKPGGAISLLVSGDPRETEVLLKTKGLKDVRSTVPKSLIFSSARVISGRKLTVFKASEG